MALTHEEYENYKALILAGKGIHHKGRTAASLPELEIIRNAKDVDPNRHPLDVPPLYNSEEMAFERSHRDHAEGLADRLARELADAKQELADAYDLIEAQEKDLASAEALDRIETLEKEIADLQAENDKLKAENAQLLDEARALVTAPLDKAPTPALTAVESLPPAEETLEEPTSDEANPEAEYGRSSIEVEIEREGGIQTVLEKVEEMTQPADTLPEASEAAPEEEAAPQSKKTGRSQSSR